MRNPTIHATCSRCGIAFDLNAEVAEKRRLRRPETLFHCVDCYQRPAKIDLNDLWVFVAKQVNA